MMKYLFSSIVLLFSISSFAAESKSSGGLPSWLPKGSSASLSLGLGPITPDSSDIVFNDKATLKLGVDVSVVGPFFLTIAGYGTTITGTMNYNFTDAKNINYTSQKVAVSQSGTGLQLGAQFRIINAGNFHLLAEGGVYGELWKFNYDFSGATTDLSLTNAPSSEYCSASGAYVQAGIDILLNNGYGIRFLARASRGSTSKLDTFKGAELNFVNGEGYAGIVKQF